MKPIETGVQSYIYRIRGQQAMLDVDLAVLYGVGTKNLNKAVSRNRERFPDDFMFQLTLAEAQNLRFQIGTSSLRSQFVISSWGGRRYLPYAFTEEGVAMLSSVLRSRRAALVNVAIMRAFVKMRHALLAHQGIARRVEKLEGKIEMHTTDIRLLVQDVQRLQEDPKSRRRMKPGFI